MTDSSIVWRAAVALNLLLRRAGILNAPLAARCQCVVSTYLVVDPNVVNLHIGGKLSLGVRVPREIATNRNVHDQIELIIKWSRQWVNVSRTAGWEASLIASS